MSIGTKIAFGYVLVTVVLVIIGVVAYRGNIQFAEDARWVTHTHEVLDDLQNVLSLLKDAETGQRGFVITGQEHYLEPYYSGVNGVDEKVEHMRALTSDNPNQQKRLDKLGPMIDEKFAELAQTIELRRDEGFDSAAEVVLTDHGKQVMDDIRVLVREMEEEERDLLVLRSQSAQATKQITNWTIVGGTVVAFVLVGTAAILITRSITGPVDALVEGAARLGRGDLDHRILATGKDEIATLATTFNDMSAKLQLRAQEVEKHSADLARVNDVLEQSNMELRQFAYIASHDLQTPLRAVAGFAQFLKEDYQDELDEKANDRIDRMVDACKRMQSMINDLLSYSRVDSRTRPFEPTDLAQVFDDVITVLEADISDAGGEVTRGALPTVRVDRAQMSQLLQNLISNGLKYHGVDPPLVHVSAEQGLKEWTIIVRDNGIGIDAKHHERIFEIFRRLHTHEKYPGTGIGLAVCRRIVNRHGGRIWLESEEGKGATFYFTIREQVVEAT